MLIMLAGGSRMHNNHCNLNLFIDHALFGYPVFREKALEDVL